MTALTMEDIQLAEKISLGVQNYFEWALKKEADSSDIYSFLSRKGIVEEHPYGGLRLRRFLARLKKADQLQLIPECRYKTSGTIRWYFSVAYHQQKYEEDKKKIQLPELSDEEINQLIESERPKIENLPKRDPSTLTPQKIKVRTKYLRAYEFWSGKETFILKKVFLATRDIYIVANLLKRQPNTIITKLKELNLM